VGATRDGVAVGRIATYLFCKGREHSPMPESLAPRVTSRPLLAAGSLITLALAGTVLLWAHYGTTIFFETIRVGFAACFG
jgi:hypothetical protein